ncbi:hypothetical protein RUND412_000634 [Rhizina undulata]
MSSSPQTFNAKSPTIKRILREASELASSPSGDYHAAPLDHNLFEWHFTLRGPPSTPYASGIYHGRITLPPQYPLRPPSFRFLTPSGRFEVNREICLSISGHHEDTWQPAWGVRTAVVALRGFMETEAGGQVGGVECSEQARGELAKLSPCWKCKDCGKSNEDILKEEERRVASDDSAARVKETIPEELRLGYRGENPAPSPASGSELGSDSTVVARLPIPESVSLPPAPTRTRLPESSPTREFQPPPQLRAETPWLDRMIWALSAILFAIIARKLLS